MLKTHKIEIESFNIRDADITVKMRADHGEVASIHCPACGKPTKANWCDLMIASVALYPPWIVVTKNVRDFSYLRDRVMEPQDFLKKYCGRR